MCTHHSFFFKVQQIIIGCQLKASKRLTNYA
jgi:hypothetical protein